MKQFFYRRWFLIALGIVLLIGFSQAEQLAPLANSRLLRNTIVACVLFLMSLPLRFGAIWQALRRPWTALLAVMVNFGLLPLVAWAASGLLSGDLAVGLLVVGATPCTLASASVWTRRAGGNDAAAVIVTIITNLSCFVITPLWLITMTGHSAKTPHLSQMVTKLALLVVLPIVIAQIVRLWRPLGHWATEKKSALSTAAQCGILSMILLGTSQAGIKLFEEGTVVVSGEIILMIFIVLGVHLSMFWSGLGIARMLRFPREDQIAVGFAGSQKTLMVGLTIAMDYGGLTLLPMVVYHVGQLLVDTLIADFLRRRGEEQKP